MRATVKTSKVRVADVDVGDVIRFDTNPVSHGTPRWSLQVRLIAHNARTNSYSVHFAGVNSPTTLRGLDLVEVQHRTVVDTEPVEVAS